MTPVIVKKIDSCASREVIKKYTTYLLDEAKDLGIFKFEKGARVLIKPNVTLGKPWNSGVTTCPYVVEGIAEWFLKYGASEVIIGEGPTIGVEAKDAFEKAGYTKIAEELGIGLLDLKGTFSKY